MGPANYAQTPTARTVRLIQYAILVIPNTDTLSIITHARFALTPTVLVVLTIMCARVACRAILCTMEPAIVVPKILTVLLVLPIASVSPVPLAMYYISICATSAQITVHHVPIIMCAWAALPATLCMRVLVITVPLPWTARPAMLPISAWLVRPPTRLTWMLVTPAHPLWIVGLAMQIINAECVCLHINCSMTPVCRAHCPTAYLAIVIASVCYARRPTHCTMGHVTRVQWVIAWCAMRLVSAWHASQGTQSTMMPAIVARLLPTVRCA